MKLFLPERVLYMYMAKRVLEDRLLVKKSQNGDLEAFEEIVKRYQQKIYWHTYKILKDKDQADDATQETFIKLFTNLDKIDNKRPLSPWIYKIATNHSYDMIKKNKKTLSLEWEIEEQATEPIDNIIKSEEKRRLRDALRKLPKKYKLPIINYYFLSHSYKEISKIFKLPLNTIRTRIRRGKLLLAKELYEK